MRGREAGMVDDARAGAAHDVLLLAPVLLLAAVAREVAPPARGEVRDDLATALVLLLCVAAWVLARRLDLPRWAAAAAAVLVPVCPPVPDVAATGDLAGVTACLLLLAGLAALAAGTVSGPGLVVGVLALAGAVVLAPALLVGLAGPALALGRAADRAPAATPRTTALRVTALLATAGAALGIGLRLPGVVGPVDPDPLSVGWLAALLGVLVVAAGLVLRRGRPLALTAAVLLAAAVAAGNDSPAVLVAAATVVVVLTLCVVDGFLRYRPTRLWRRDVRRPVLAVAAVTALAAAVAVVPAWAQRLTHPGLTIVAGPVPGDPADPVAPADPADPVAPAPAPSVTPLATGPASPTVDPEPAPPTSTPTADPGLARAGAQLATNPALRLSSAARADLEAGRVDPRVLATLATVAGTQTVEVDAFPPADAADTGLLRSVRISGLDGGPVDRGTPATTDLLAVLDAQRAEFHPLVDYERTASGAVPMLLLTFPLEDA
ncbi:hypothetical protein KMZ32_11220 [Phycicoccus sp. MAQZ13P-2]|uniref:hypothetical protein n=1 Tax=Phycicoccus mangrovi TaxID=2840470 RepID=UPI001BFFF41A|nr:hypothetical protein [Phycicoccus mangrovi]MBT9257835.1 hypothetical protein [Phycicoccus mangrovi]MBT9274641.1 hypothetical protein [Phycicoccus mangrovi]